MPDITMCYGEGCDKKENCYRYKAEPDTYQSYAQYEPKGCDSYWPMDNFATENLQKHHKPRENFPCESCNKVGSVCEHGHCAVCSCQHFCWLD